MAIKSQPLTGLTFSLNDKITLDKITSGTVSGYIVKDGGLQASIANTPVHEGNGQWSVDLSAIEMDADVVGVLFRHINAIPVHFPIITSITTNRPIRAQAVLGFPFLLVNRESLLPVTSGVVTLHLTKDGLIQGTLAGTPVHRGNGQWIVDITAVEMNAENIGIIAFHEDAVPTNTTLITSVASVSAPSPVTIADLALAPKRVRTDEGTVEERPLDEVIQALAYTDPIASSGAPWGIAIARAKPSSALGGNPMYPGNLPRQ